MYTKQIDINEKTAIKRSLDASKIYFNCKFNFINQHNGIRPNKFHLFVAPTHVGKSTFVHSLIESLIMDNDNIKILLVLTEETIHDFESAISLFIKDFKKINECLRVMVEDSNESEEDIMQYYQEAIEMHNPDIFFIDNITTSKLYISKTPSEQDAVATWLKTLTMKTTLFAIAHTNGNNYNTEMLDETHIRGSKTITNLVEFLYVMQPVRLNDSLYQYIRVIKHRGQSMLNSFFLLDYNKKTRTIKSDRPVEFDDFKSAFKLRNRLW